MSEQEILKIMKNLILMPCDWKIADKYDGKIDFIGSLEGNEAIQGLLDLYNNTKKSEEVLANKLQEVVIKLNKEKEKNKELEEYANWHIEHLTEDIADYIDDDRKGNASIIGEFKEEREHWKDIIRIINNEKTYIDYKNF